MAGLLIALVGGVITSTWLYVRADGDRWDKEAMNRVFTGFFESVDPELDGNRQVTVREFLDDAVTAIDKGSLANRPGVEATIRQTLGITYRNLGYYNQSQSLLKKAWKLNRRTYGQVSPLALETAHELALAHAYAGEWQTAKCL